MLPSVARLVNEYDLTSIFITAIKTIRDLIASIINRNTRPIIAGKLQLRVALKLNCSYRNHQKIFIRATFTIHVKIIHFIILQWSPISRKCVKCYCDVFGKLIFVLVTILINHKFVWRYMLTFVGLDMKENANEHVFLLINLAWIYYTEFFSFSMKIKWCE